VKKEDEETTKMENPEMQTSQTINQDRLPESETAGKASELLNTDHWLKSYVVDLLSAHQRGGGVDFDTAGHLLEQHKKAFEAELAVARRFYHNYPHLFHESHGMSTEA
jgi:hypothetical protein